MILDTEYLGSLADGNPDATAKARRLDASPVPKRVPTAVLWEAYTGIGKIAPGRATTQLRRIYRRLVSSRSVVDLTPRIARRAGELNGEHEASDRLSTLDGVDSVVAAHGLELSEPVVSNDSDFRDVTGLSVETY